MKNKVGVLHTYGTEGGSCVVVVIGQNGYNFFQKVKKRSKIHQNRGPPPLILLIKTSKTPFGFRPPHFRNYYSSTTITRITFLLFQPILVINMGKVIYFTFFVLVL